MFCGYFYNKEHKSEKEKKNAENTSEKSLPLKAKS